MMTPEARAVVKAIARILCKRDGQDPDSRHAPFADESFGAENWEFYTAGAEEILAIIEPIIRADERERSIRFVAEWAHSVGAHAGVGASETAGMFLSILARHPEWIAPFFADGPHADGIDMFRAENGCLTFHNKAGAVTTPQELHASREVAKIAAAIRQRREG